MAPETGAWAAWKRSGVPAERDAGTPGTPNRCRRKRRRPSKTPNEPAETRPSSRPRNETTVSPDDEESGLPYPRVDPNAEVMVLVQVSPAGHDPAKARDACARLAAALAAAAAQTPGAFPLTRSLAQTHEGCANAAPADAVLCDLTTGARVTASECTIHEELCGLRFTLSASAFFQVNTCAAEALYRLAGEWASPTGKSLLLDVCCGTGTIGLTLAARARKVVGVDIVEAAIEDAEKNAALNGVTNCEWVAGRAELKLPEILNKHAPEIKPAPPISRCRKSHPRRRTPRKAEARRMRFPRSPTRRRRLRRRRRRRRRTATTRARRCRAALRGRGKKRVSRERSYEYDDVVAVVDPRARVCTRMSCTRFAPRRGCAAWCTSRATRRAWRRTARTCARRRARGAILGARRSGRSERWPWICSRTRRTAKPCCCWRGRADRDGATRRVRRVRLNFSSS